MQDEDKYLAIFLDECVQKCLRTPYKYVEALRSLASTSAPSSRSIGVEHSNQLEEYPSPLLTTLLEHLESGLSNRSLPATHIIAVTSFIGRLTIYLLAKSNPEFLRAFVDKIEAVLLRNYLLDEGQDKTEAVVIALRRDVKIMRSALISDATSELEMESETQRWMAALKALSLRGSFDFSINIISDLQTAESKAARKYIAFRIIDSLRTMPTSLPVDQLKQLFTFMVTLDLSVFPRVIESLVPGQADLWQAMQLVPNLRPQYEYFNHLGPVFAHISNSNLKFEWLYLHTRSEQLLDEDKQKALVESIYSHKPTVLDLRRVVYRITHGITVSMQKQNILKTRVALLARISDVGKLALCNDDFESLREVIFVQSSALRDVFLSPMSVEVLNGETIFIIFTC